MNQTDNVKVLRFLSSFMNELADLLGEEELQQHEELKIPTVLDRPTSMSTSTDRPTPSWYPKVDNDTEFKQLKTIFAELINAGEFSHEDWAVSLQGVGQKVSHYLDTHGISGKVDDSHRYFWPDIPQVRDILSNSVKDRLTGRTFTKPLKYPRK